MELRTKYQDDFVKKHGIKLGLMSFFLKASTIALHEFPAVNSVIKENSIITRNFIDISVAVASPCLLYFFLFCFNLYVVISYHAS